MVYPEYRPLASQCQTSITGLGMGSQAAAAMSESALRTGAHAMAGKKRVLALQTLRHLHQWRRPDRPGRHSVA
jgi:hypothetical protein